MPAYENAVVAVDDSPAGDRVVEVAALLAAEAGSNLTLVATAERAGSALQRAAAACAEMGAGSVEAITRAGAPAKVLAGVAGERGAGLVFLGSHALSKLGGAREVVRTATFDVLIAHTTSSGWLKLTSRRGRSEASAYQRTVVVGVHQSDHSFRAAERAGALAADLDAELIIAGAYQRTTKKQLSGWKRLEDRESELGDEGLAEIETALSEGASRARLQGAQKVETLAVKGDVIQALLSVVEARDTDVLVIGNHPESEGTSRLIGSISTRLSRKAPTHVLLVH